MWWLAAILWLNFALPSRVLYDQWGFSVAGFRATPLDALIFLGPVLTLLPGWGSRSESVLRLHPAFVLSLVLLVLAIVQGAVVGLSNTDPLIIKYYFQSMRNILIVLVGMYMGYQILGSRRQTKSVVIVLVIASVLSAVAMVITGGGKTAGMADIGTVRFDEFRETRDQPGGDFGVTAAAVVLFAWVSGVPFSGLPVSLLIIGCAGLGTLFVSHRSSWLVAATAWAFATFYLRKSLWQRKILLGSFGVVSVLVFFVIGIFAVENYLGREGYSDWVFERVASLLPQKRETMTESKAWDTRLPGMWYDLNMWADSPFTGGGFGIHEANALRTGDWVSFKHTPWTSTLAETGPIGVAAFGTIIFGAFVVAIRLSRESTDRWSMLLGAATATFMFTMIIYGAVTLSWNSPRMAADLGILAGLTFRCRDLALTASGLSAHGVAEWDGQHLLAPLSQGQG